MKQYVTKTYTKHYYRAHPLNEANMPQKHFEKCEHIKLDMVVLSEAVWVEIQSDIIITSPTLIIFSSAEAQLEQQLCLDGKQLKQLPDQTHTQCTHLPLSQNKQQINALETP